MEKGQFGTSSIQTKTKPFPSHLTSVFQPGIGTLLAARPRLGTTACLYNQDITYEHLQVTPKGKKAAYKRCPQSYDRSSCNHEPRSKALVGTVSTLYEGGR